MKKYLLMLFIAMFGVSGSVCAKDTPQYAKVLLTLKDKTVLNGYLCCDLHSVNKKIFVSETIDEKSVSYQIAEIDSLVVTYTDGVIRTYRPIYVWDGLRKKVSKTPVLASVCYTGDNITGYMAPSMYVKSTAPVPSNYFQSYTTQKRAWTYYKKIKSESELIKYYYSYIPSKKTPKIKSILKNIKNNFKKEDFQYICDTVESQGITAEMIIQKPWLLLEILDKRPK